jgi:hypothetical protein
MPYSTSLATINASGGGRAGEKLAGELLLWSAVEEHDASQRPMRWSLGKIGKATDKL